MAIKLQRRQPLNCNSIASATALRVQWQGKQETINYISDCDSLTRHSELSTLRLIRGIGRSMRLNRALLGGRIGSTFVGLRRLRPEAIKCCIGHDNNKKSSQNSRQTYFPEVILISVVFFVTSAAAIRFLRIFAFLFQGLEYFGVITKLFNPGFLFQETEIFFGNDVRIGFIRMTLCYFLTIFFTRAIYDLDFKMLQILKCNILS